MTLVSGRGKVSSWFIQCHTVKYFPQNIVYFLITGHKGANFGAVLYHDN